MSTATKSPNFSKRTSALATVAKLEMARDTLEGIKKNMPNNVTRINSLQRLITLQIAKHNEIAATND